MIILEYFYHQRINRAAYDEIYMCFQSELIPEVLNIAINRLVYIEKFLKFIDYQSKMSCLSLL